MIGEIWGLEKIRSAGSRSASFFFFFFLLFLCRGFVEDGGGMVGCELVEGAGKLWRVEVVEVVVVVVVVELGIGFCLVEDVEVVAACDKFAKSS